jgi:hypothetical protein
VSLAISKGSQEIFVENQTSLVTLGFCFLKKVQSQWQLCYCVVCFLACRQQKVVGMLLFSSTCMLVCPSSRTLEQIFIKFVLEFQICSAFQCYICTPYMKNHMHLYAYQEYEYISPNITLEQKTFHTKGTIFR